MNAACNGSGRSGEPSPSIVTTSEPATERAGAMQERTARPSTSTVHAPHWASPQPKWVPVRARSFRSTYSSGVSGSSVSTSRAVPFTLSVSLAMCPSPGSSCARVQLVTALAGPREPLLVARRGTAGEAARDQAGGVVPPLERQVALHHRLLVDLPLGVAAPDAVHLGLDRLEVAQGAHVVARREGGGAQHERQHHAGRDRVALGSERAEAVRLPVQRGLVAARRVGEGGVHLAEEEAGTRDLLGQVGEGAPRQRAPLRVELQPPQQRGAVGHGGAGVARGQDLALEDLHRVRVAAGVQREHRLVPGHVAVERGAPVVARHPLVEEGGARLAVEGLERDVGEVVRRVSVPRVLLQGSLREPARLVEAVHLVIGEGERGLVPPVVTVGGGQALHERDPILLSVGGAGQGDRAAHLVHQHRVAREILHVLVGQREAPRALAAHEGVEGLAGLALPPRRAAHRLPRAGHRGARGGGVARDEGQQGPAGVRHREAGVGLHRLGEPRLALGAIGQQVVHAFLEALEGDGRVGGDGQAVTVGERHGKGPQTSRVRGSSIRSASAPRKRAPRAPSRARWSQERVSTIVGCTAGLPSTGITRSVMRPTARIAAWGGLTMALNASTPYMPRLLIVKTPPWISAGRSLPACARATRSSRRAAISLRPRVSARWITGTTSPSSSATAKPTLTSGCRSITPSLHETATRGCCTMAAATSLIRRSVYVMRTPVWARALSSHAPSRATATSRTKKKCGALVHDAAIRSAITRHTVPKIGR